MCLLPYSDECPRVPAEVGRTQTFVRVSCGCAWWLWATWEPILPIGGSELRPQEWGRPHQAGAGHHPEGAQLVHLGLVAPQSAGR